MGVREGLLALLTTGPKHGYQLRQEFEAATAGVWPLNIGQVYTTLDRLQRDGLVEPVDAAGAANAGPTAGSAGAAGGSSDRRSYRLTADGRAELGDWFSSGPEAAPHREPTVIKVLVALHTEGVDVRQVVQVQRQALIERLAEQQRARRKALGDDAPADPLDLMTGSMMFDALVTRTEADLRWLDLCDEHLRTLPAPARTRKDRP